MAKLPEFEKCDQWHDIARKHVDKRPDFFGHIDLDKIAAFVITNKDEADSARPYEMQVDKLPMRLSNPYEFFVWFKTEKDWFGKNEAQKVALVFAALCRIAADDPTKVGPLDYRDQAVMVYTLGPGWWINPDIKNLLTEEVVVKNTLDAFDDGTDDESNDGDDGADGDDTEDDDEV